MDDLSLPLILVFLVGGSLAGFIDSIAGGGGLLTLPLLSIVLGPGADAIGTNKIVGTVGAATALYIYAKDRKVDWHLGLRFVLGIAAGSFLGSLLSPLIPVEWIRWFLIAACPILLLVVWSKDRWVEISKRELAFAQHRNTNRNVIISALICGIYDGAFGPGGGTFMFLALLFVAGLPLFSALALSKLANTVSAGTALVSFAAQGYVHWYIGFILSLGIFFGAQIGARLNLRKAAGIVRPMLAVAVLLLLIRLTWDAFAGR